MKKQQFRVIANSVLRRGISKEYMAQNAADHNELIDRIALKFNNRVHILSVISGLSSFLVVEAELNDAREIAKTFDCQVTPMSLTGYGDQK